MLQFAVTTLLFVHLVDIEKGAAVFRESLGGIEERVLREVHAVGKYEEGLICLVAVEDVLKEKGRLAHAARADNAEHAALPMNMRVEIPNKLVRRASEQSIHIFIELITGASSILHPLSAIF